MAEGFLKWWPVLVVLLNLLVLWIGWSMRKQFVTHDQFDQFKVAHDKSDNDTWKEHGQVHHTVDSQLAAGAARFREIETTLEHLPTRQDHETLIRSIGDLKATLQGVGAKVDGVATIATGLQSQVAMIVDHELAEGRQAKGAK